MDLVFDFYFWLHLFYVVWIGLGPDRGLVQMDPVTTQAVEHSLIVAITDDEWLLLI